MAGEEIDFGKNNPKLYGISANAYLLTFIGRVKKMSKGLIKIVPKYKDGKPIKGIETVLLDFDSDKEGIQEGKEWLAVIAYLKSFKDEDGNGIPDIPLHYKEAKPICYCK